MPSPCHRDLNMKKSRLVETAMNEGVEMKARCWREVSDVAAELARLKLCRGL